MKKLIAYSIAIAIFFIGVGSIVDRAGASFKSDAKALEIVNRARLAIGGDAAIAQVNGMVINGRSTHTFKIGDSVRTEPGEMEIALQLPDKLAKKIKIGNGAVTSESALSVQKNIIVTSKGEAIKIQNGTSDGQFVTAEGKNIRIVKAEAGDHTFTTEDGKTVVVKTAKKVPGELRVTAQKDGEDIVITRGGETKTFTTEDGKTVTLTSVAREGLPADITAEGPVKYAATMVYADHKQNELVRLSLALLLTAPQGHDVTYSFVGESILDGAPVNIVNAAVAGSVYKIYFDAGSSLPIAMSYRSNSLPTVVKFRSTEAAPAGETDVVVAGKATGSEPVEKLVKFSDYRTTDGVQLPYKWTTEVSGTVSDVFDVTNYEINPANISEKFPKTNKSVRISRTDGQ